MAFVCLLRVDLHLPEGSDLKGKRKQLSSLKGQLRQRFGVAVAETAHHDRWQRSELAIALVAGEAGALAERADAVERFVTARHPDGAAVRRALVSADELMDG